MGKYALLERDIFDIFSDSAWVAENIKTVPNGVPLTGAGIRVSIIPSGSGLNLISASGVLIIDIFIAAGEGPNQASLIADKLDSYLAGKVKSLAGKATQFLGSSMAPAGRDKDNPKLDRYSYKIPFKHFGVK